MRDDGKDDDEDGVCRRWRRVRVLEALNLIFRTPMALGCGSFKVKVVIVPALPSSQEQDKCTGKGTGGTGG